MPRLLHRPRVWLFSTRVPLIVKFSTHVNLLKFVPIFTWAPTVGPILSGLSPPILSFMAIPVGGWVETLLLYFSPITARLGSARLAYSLSLLQNKEIESTIKKGRERGRGKPARDWAKESLGRLASFALKGTPLLCSRLTRSRAVCWLLFFESGCSSKIIFLLSIRKVSSFTEKGRILLSIPAEYLDSASSLCF